MKSQEKKKSISPPEDSKKKEKIANTAWVLGRSYNLEPYTITSDSGWGCMLRAAQMLMGYTLRRHYLGTEWRIPKLKEELLRKNEDYCELIRWFLDFPGFPHIYSIHHLVQCGMKYDKLPGEWHAPSTASYVLRDLSKLHRLRYQGEIAVLVTQSETIYISDVEKLCSNLSLNENFFGLQDSNHLLNNASFTEKFHRLSLNMRFSTARKKHSSRSIDVPADSIHPPPVKEPEGLSPSADNGGFFDPLFRPPPSQINPWVYSLLVLIPLRLGISSVNEEYIAELKEVLQLPACVGILGGRPNHAIYFTGYNAKDNVLYGHDPHTVFANPSEAEVFDSSLFPSDDFIRQVHVKDFVTLDFKSLDPSLAVGFYFQNRSEFNDFCNETRARNDAKKATKQTLLYQIEMMKPAYLDDSEGISDKLAGDAETTSSTRNGAAGVLGIASDDFFDEHQDPDEKDDEYVFL